MIDIVFVHNVSAEDKKSLKRWINTSLANPQGFGMQTYIEDLQLMLDDDGKPESRPIIIFNCLIDLIDLMDLSARLPHVFIATHQYPGVFDNRSKDRHEFLLDGVTHTLRRV